MQSVTIQRERVQGVQNRELSCRLYIFKTHQIDVYSVPLETYSVILLAFD